MCGRARFAAGAADRLDTVAKAYGVSGQSCGRLKQFVSENVSPGATCPALCMAVQPQESGPNTVTHSATDSNSNSLSSNSSNSNSNDVDNSKSNSSSAVSSNSVTSLSERCSSVGQHHVYELKWGLVPSYNKGEAPNHYRMFNKRIEALDSSHFKKLLRNNRCVVFLDGFYEWKVIAGKKHPHYIHLNTVMQAAGIYDDCPVLDPNNGIERIIRTFAIITCDASPNFREVHDRCPVLLSDEQMHRWLDPQTDLPSLMKELEAVPNSSTSFINNEIAFYPVTPKMTNPRYQEKDCTQRVSLGKDMKQYLVTKEGPKASDSGTSSKNTSVQVSPVHNYKGSVTSTSTGKRKAIASPQSGGKSKTLFNYFSVKK